MENNLEIEQQVLSSLILISDPSSNLINKAMGIIKESSFAGRNHRIIYRAINSLINKGEMLDLITVSDLSQKLDSNGDDFFVYLANVMNNAVSSANIIAYCRILREQAVERYALSKLNEAIGMFNDKSNGDVYQRLGLAESYLSEISNMSMRNDKAGLIHIGEVSGLWMDNIEQINKDGGDRNKITTGIDSLDEVLGVKGMRRGSLIAVGARPKMGKTAFLTLLANHIALDLKQPTAIFSMEMPSVDIFERSFSGRTLENPAEFYRKNIHKETQGKMNVNYPTYLESKMYVDDTPAVTVQHIQREARQIHKKYGSMGLICVDYLTLMEAGKAERNDLAYGAITKALKNLAKELNCVVLMLTQLNRGLENRPDKRPMPSDSRDTGQIEQDVDLWLGLYKESVYEEEIDTPGLTEVIVRLNRHGGTGTAFVEMKQGFHVPVETTEAAKILNTRAMAKAKPEEEERKRVTYKKK